MTAFALEQLLDSKKAVPCTVIYDSVQSGCLSLLAEYARRSLDDGDHGVIAVLTESSAAAWESRVGFAHTTIDVQLANLDDPRSMIHTILEPIKTALSSQCTIIIESLTPLAWISTRDTYQLVQDLIALTTDTVRLIIGYHADIHYAANAPFSHVSLRDALNVLASAIVTLEPLPERNEDNSLLTGFVTEDAFSYMKTTSNLFTRCGIAQIEWRRKSGKVQFEVNGYYLDTITNTLVVVSDTQLIGTSPKKDSEVPEKEPVVDATFNLSLTDSQRKAKDSLVLPYLKAQQQHETAPVGSGAGTGIIYYEPDTGDDFDDEDPDDDLDI